MSNPITIIVELAQAHEGSLGILHSYIDALAHAGVDAVKFQTHIAEAESSAYEPFRVNFSYVDKTRFDYWKRMEFSPEQWRGIKQHCDDAGVEFMSSPFSIAAVELLEELGVERYKIASGEVANFLLLERIAKTGKPILLSSGMSSLAELDETMTFLSAFSNPISIMQCTTGYPTSPEQLGLNVIGELRSRYGVPVGFSDHSGQIFAPLAAVALGAEMVEFHATFDKRMFGPDATASLTIDETKTVVDGIRYLERAVANPIDKTDNEAFTDLKRIFEKSLAVNKDLPVGHVLTFDDLESKKPAGQGLPARLYRDVIGKTLCVPKQRNDFLQKGDI